MEHLSNPDERVRESRSERIGPLIVAGAFLIWLAPIGVGGRMPVGGDVTRFQIGLMGVLRRALATGRLPLWNDRWGFGFPGLAESQMGVYYPPHAVLYSLFFTEAAYTISLLGHVLLGGLGAFVLARRFGGSVHGGVLAAIAWGMSGFAVIHLSHQWAYTAGAWMPWTWMLAWRIVRGQTGMRTTLALAAILALQVLPGHFQIAFITQVGALTLALWACLDRPDGQRRNFVGAVRIIAAVALVLPLSAMQLWPTWELARLADTQRDYAYLSAFAAPPTHYVSLVAPGLFHVSPLWRPIVWDPFHAMPEEHWAYLGLVPLWLAIRAVRQGWKRDPSVRALSLLALVTLLLSFGPYLPGFRGLILLPGFSFFRAPARWEIGLLLALACLSAKGLATLTDRRDAARSLRRFALAVVILAVIPVGLFELALASSARPGMPAVASGFDRILKWLPWSQKPSFREVMAEARRPPSNPLVQMAVLRQGGEPARARLDRDRSAIYKMELGETAIVVLALLILSVLMNMKRLESALVIFTFVDLMFVGRHREIETAPLAPLAAQSPVLAELGASGRSIDELGNLAMVAGGAPVVSYRTLDQPVARGLANQALMLPSVERSQQLAREAITAAGASVRVFHPFETESLETARAALPGIVDQIHDPALGSWEFGRRWVNAQDTSDVTYTLWKPDVPTSRAWLVNGTPDLADERLLLPTLAVAKPLPWRSRVPEEFAVTLDVREPATVVVSQWCDPHWHATWTFGERHAEGAAVVPAFVTPGGGGWQAIHTPKRSGRWTLTLRYDGTSARTGQVVSVIAWAAWSLACLWSRFHDSSGHFQKRHDS